MREKRALIAMAALLLSCPALAENKPQVHDNDSRIKTIIYRENDVIPISASYKHITHIDLGVGEKIVDIAAGDTESWMFATTANNDGILLKPLSSNAKTNLTVITEKRKYYFDLNRATASKTFSVNFKYPADEFKKFQDKMKRDERASLNKQLGVDPISPENWNFNYLLEGDNEVSPVNIFDDGKFTYLEFGKKEIPAIFSVDKNRNESVVNFHKKGRYIVIENIYRQLTLRKGSDMTCILNKEYDVQIFSEPSLKNND